MTHVVKRYVGERLYDTSTLTYTTVELLRALRAKAEPILVMDATTGEDVTQIVLGHL